MKTPKGTELPLIQLKGKDYLQVAYRLIWFREEHPDWSIVTEAVSNNDTAATVKASILDEKGRVIATAHKTEHKAHFADHLEKAETGSIGRALALIGYGTQFALADLDEGERVVDSPLEAKKPVPNYAPQSKPSPTKISVAPPPPQEESTGPGGFVIQFGRKYKGKKLESIPIQEMDSYIRWLDGQDGASPGTPMHHQIQFLKKAFEEYKAELRAKEPPPIDENEPIPF